MSREVAKETIKIESINFEGSLENLKNSIINKKIDVLNLRSEQEEEVKAIIYKHLKKQHVSLRLEDKLLRNRAWSYLHGRTQFTYESDSPEKRGKKKIYYFDGLDFISSDKTTFALKGTKENREKIAKYEAELDVQMNLAKKKMGELENAIKAMGRYEVGLFGNKNEEMIRDKYVELIRLIEGLDNKIKDTGLKKYLDHLTEYSQLKRKLYDISVGFYKGYQWVPYLIQREKDTKGREEANMLVEKSLYQEGNLQRQGIDVIGLVDDMNPDQALGYIIQKQQEIGSLPIVDKQKEPIRKYFKLLYDSVFDKINSNESGLSQAEKNQYTGLLMQLMTGRIENGAKKHPKRNQVISISKKTGFPIKEVTFQLVYDEFEEPTQAYEFGNIMMLNSGVWDQLLSKDQFNRNDPNVKDIPGLYNKYSGFGMPGGGMTFGSILKGTEKKGFAELNLQQKTTYSILSKFDEILQKIDPNASPDTLSEEDIIKYRSQSEELAAGGYESFLKSKFNMVGFGSNFAAQTMSSDFGISWPEGSELIFDLMMNTGGSGITISDNTAKMAKMGAEIVAQIAVTILIGMATGGIGAVGTWASSATRIAGLSARMSKIAKTFKYAKYIQQSKRIRAGLGAGVASVGTTMIMETGVLGGTKRGHINLADTISDRFSQLLGDGLSGALGVGLASKLSKVMVKGGRVFRGANFTTKMAIISEKTAPVLTNIGVAGLDFGAGMTIEYARQQLLGNDDIKLRELLSSPAGRIALVFGVATMKTVKHKDWQAITRKCDYIREQVDAGKLHGLETITIETDFGRQTMTIQEILNDLPTSGDKKPTSMSKNKFDKASGLAKVKNTKVDDNAILSDQMRSKQVEEALREQGLLNGKLQPYQSNLLILVHNLSVASLDGITALRQKLGQGIINRDEFNNQVWGILTADQTGPKPETWRHDSEHIKSKDAALQIPGGFDSNQARFIIKEGYAGRRISANERTVRSWLAALGPRVLQINDDDTVAINLDASTYMIDANRSLEDAISGISVLSVGTDGSIVGTNRQDLTSLRDQLEGAIISHNYVIPNDPSYSNLQSRIRSINSAIQNNVQIIDNLLKISSGLSANINVNGTTFNIRSVISNNVNQTIASIENALGMYSGALLDGHNPTVVSSLLTNLTSARDRFIDIGQSLENLNHTSAIGRLNDQINNLNAIIAHITQQSDAVIKGARGSDIITSSANLLTVDFPGGLRFDTNTELGNVVLGQTNTATQINTFIDNFVRTSGGALEDSHRARVTQMLQNLTNSETEINKFINDRANQTALGSGNPSLGRRLSTRLQEIAEQRSKLEAIRDRISTRLREIEFGRSPVGQLQQRMDSLGTSIGVNDSLRGIPPGGGSGANSSLFHVVYENYDLDRFVTSINNYDIATQAHTWVYFLRYYLETTSKNGEFSGEVNSLKTRLDQIIEKLEVRRHGAGSADQGGLENNWARQQIGDQVGWRGHTETDLRQGSNWFLREQNVFEQGIMPVLSILSSSNNNHARKFAVEMGYKRNLVKRWLRNLADANVADMQNKYNRLIGLKDEEFKGLFGDLGKQVNFANLARLAGLGAIVSPFGMWADIIGAVVLTAPTFIAKLKGRKMTREAMVNEIVANIVGGFAGGSVLIKNFDFSLSGLIGGLGGGIAGYAAGNYLTSVAMNLLPVNALQRNKIAFAIKLITTVILGYLGAGGTISDVGAFVGNGVATIVKIPGNIEDRQKEREERAKIKKILNTGDIEGKTYLQVVETLRQVKDADGISIYENDILDIESICLDEDLNEKSRRELFKKIEQLYKKHLIFSNNYSGSKESLKLYLRNNAYNIDSMTAQIPLSRADEPDFVKSMLAKYEFEQNKDYTGKAKASFDQDQQWMLDVDFVVEAIKKDAWETIKTSAEGHPDMTYLQIAKTYYERVFDWISEQELSSMAKPVIQSSSSAPEETINIVIDPNALTDRQRQIMINEYNRSGIPVVSGKWMCDGDGFHRIEDDD